MVTFSTRKENTLDLILTSHPSFTERCKPLPPITEKSDHDIVLFDLATQPVRARPKRRTLYLWKKANTIGIKQSLAQYSETFLNQTFSSVDEMWENFKAAIEKVIQEFVPTRRTLARQTHPWIDNHLRKLTNRKQCAYKRARKTNNPSDWNRYNRLCTQTQREIRQSHRKYMTEVISDSYKDQPKKFWSYIKTRKQESFGIAPLKNKDGFIHSDAKTKAEILNDQFQSVFTQEDTANVPDKGLAHTLPWKISPSTPTELRNN